ncbi:MAG: metal ABC transporter substrate-binding protein [Pseudomonadota bacterium]
MIPSKLTRLLLAALLMMATSIMAHAQDRPRIVAVNYPLKYFAERLAGDSADVIFPVPEGVDPSFWRPSISDVSMIQSADLVLLNGAGFAAWIDRVSLPRSRLVNTTARLEDLFIVTESITHSHGDGGEHSHEGLASYTWLDPTIAAQQAEAIANALVQRGLVTREAIEPRLASLQTELVALDDGLKAALESVRDVPFIATHPRYHYFARRYGLSISYLDWEAGAMPTQEQLATLSAMSEKTGARGLIWEAQPPQSAVEAVAELGFTSAVLPPYATVPASAEDLLDALEEAAKTLALAAQ